jgi:hypothetical protein
MHIKVELQEEIIKVKEKCKKHSTVLFIIICLLSFTMGATTAKAYVSLSAKGFYNSSLPSGIAQKSLDMINSAGIGYTTTPCVADSGVYIFKMAMNVYEAVFVHAHGSYGLVTLSASGNNLYGTTVDSWTNGSISSRLVYLSACKSGTPSDIYGDLPAKIISKGVGTVVSFKQIITASTSTNGIHRFNALAVSNMINGYGVAQAMSLAWITFKAECDAAGSSYFGADSYRITGYGDYMLRHT